MNELKPNIELTFDQIKNDYLAVRELTRENGTYKGDKTHTRIFSEWLTNAGLNNLPFSQISKFHIEKFSLYLSSPADKGGRHLDKGTCMKYYDYLCNIYSYAIKRDIVSVRPLDLFIIPPQHADNSAQLIPTEKIAPLLADMEENDFQLFVAFMLVWACGLRPRKELRTRRVKDFDLNQGSVRISADQSKVDRTDFVTMPDWLVLILKKYGIENANSELYLFGRKGTFGEKYISENMFCYRFNRFREKHGLPKGVKFYSAKHNGGLDFLDSVGGNVLELMHHYRHSKLTTTQRYVEKKLGQINIKYQHNSVNPITLHK
jgi:integrase